MARLEGCLQLQVHTCPSKWAGFLLPLPHSFYCCHGNHGQVVFLLENLVQELLETVNIYSALRGAVMEGLF